MFLISHLCGRTNTETSSHICSLLFCSHKYVVCVLRTTAWEAPPSPSVTAVQLTLLYIFTSFSIPSLSGYLVSSPHTFFHCFTFTVSLSLSLFVSSSSSVVPPQVPGQLHGRRQGRLHEGKSAQRHAHHHPSEKVHGAHQDHVPTGEEAQAGVASSDGGRRRPGQPIGRGRSGGSSVPRVRLYLKYHSFSHFAELLIFLHLGSVTSPPLRFWPSSFPAIRVQI